MIYNRKGFIIYHPQYERKICLCFDCAKEMEENPQDHLLKNEKLKTLLTLESKEEYDSLCYHLQCEVF